MLKPATLGHVFHQEKKKKEKRGTRVMVMIICPLYPPVAVVFYVNESTWNIWRSNSKTDFQHINLKK